MSLQFFRDSHTPSWPTVWRYTNALLVGAMCVSAVGLVIAGRQTEGYALGALVLSIVTCGYASMMHDRTMMIYDAVKEMNRRNETLLRGFTSVVEELGKKVDRASRG